MKKRPVLLIAALMMFTAITIYGCGGKEVSQTSPEDSAPPVSAAEEIIEDVESPAEASQKPPVAAAEKKKPSEAAGAVKPAAEAPTANLQQPGPVDTASVLNVIPGDAAGVVYIHSLIGLNQEINALLAELVPNEPPQDIIAKALAGAFNAGFESLEELEELGLDMEKNFAVFFSGLNPPVLSAVVHIKDPASVKQLIEAQAEGASAATHNGVTYYTTGEGAAFVLMEDVMVYSSAVETCKSAIDTYKRATSSIATHPNYNELAVDTTSDANDIIAYFDMAPIVPMLSAGAESMKANMGADADENPELASGLAASHRLIDGVISLLNQAKSLSLTLQLNGADLQISPFLKFKPESNIQAAIQTAPAPLTQLQYLPQTAFLNGGMRLKKEDIVRLASVLKMFIPADPHANQEEVEKAFQAYTEATKALWAPLGDELAFSANFSNNMMPDMFFIADVIDEKKAKAQIDGYLAYLKTAQSLYEAMGAPESANSFAGATVGDVEQYKDVEVKSYALPNASESFSRLPPQLHSLAPERWNVYFAMKSGKMISSVGSSSQPIKEVLDRLDGANAGFNQGPGYDKLASALTLKNNMLIAISPITAAKDIIKMASQAEPNAAMMMMLLGNMPETYSIGIAGQNRNGGVEGKLFISLSDFRDLINMMVNIRQMQQMERM